VREAELRAIEPLQEKGLLAAPRATPERLLRELVSEWLAELDHAGRNKGHVAKLRGRIEKMLSLTSLIHLTELADPTASSRISKAIVKLKAKKASVELPTGKEFTPAQVRHLFALSESGLNKFTKSHGIAGNGRAGKAKRYTPAEVEKIARLKSRGLSPNSINGHAVAVAAFCNWLRKRSLLERTPYLPLRADEKVDRRIIRRAITWEDCKKLASATEKQSAKAIRGSMIAAERAALYLTAFASMLRSRALRELRPADCHLETDKAWLQIRAETDKTGTSRAIPLPPEVAKKLAAIIAGKAKNSPIWKMPLNMAPVLRADMKIADIPCEEDGGRFDFHGFRHAGATHLALKGVALDSIAKIGGWSNLQQFFSRYGHYSVGGLSEATKGAW
jgi:integrase